MGVCIHGELAWLKVAGTGEYGDICITYEDINQAVYEARSKIGEVPKEIYELSSVYPEYEHIAVPAEIIIETTRIIAHSYTRAFGNGSRNFEKWSSDVDDT
ncbi:hypothetical protein TNCV_3106301 [Trichonephila clavipes]|nr:hypothetical protein TNCV_3106301 [Trichonephila clavipes]